MKVRYSTVFVLKLLVIKNVCYKLSVFHKHIYILLLVIGLYTKAANSAGSVQAFPWMGPKTTTSFILIVLAFIYCPYNGMGPIFYLHTDARQLLVNLEPRPLCLMSTTLTDRPHELTEMCTLLQYNISYPSCLTFLEVASAYFVYVCPAPVVDVYVELAY